MNTRDRRTRQEYALLICGEFFRDEFRHGDGFNERLGIKFQDLRGLCFDALGNPSMRDADDIKRRYNELNGKRP